MTAMTRNGKRQVQTSPFQRRRLQIPINVSQKCNHKSYEERRGFLTILPDRAFDVAASATFPFLEVASLPDAAVDSYVFFPAPRDFAASISNISFQKFCIFSLFFLIVEASPLVVDNAVSCASFGLGGFSFTAIESISPRETHECCISLQYSSSLFACSSLYKRRQMAWAPGGMLRRRYPGSKTWLWNSNCTWKWAIE